MDLSLSGARIRVRLVKVVFPRAASYFVGLQLGANSEQKKKTERAAHTAAPTFERSTFVWTLPEEAAAAEAALKGSLHLGAYVALPAAEDAEAKRKSRQLGSATVSLAALAAALRTGSSVATQCAFVRRSSRTDHCDTPVGSALIEVQLFPPGSSEDELETAMETPLDCLEISILGARVVGASASAASVAPTLRVQARTLSAEAAKTVEEADRARALEDDAGAPPSDALVRILTRASEATHTGPVVAVTSAVPCAAAGAEAEGGEPIAWTCLWNSKLWVSVPTARTRADPSAAPDLGPSAAVRVELAELVGGGASGEPGATSPSRAKFAAVAGFSIPIVDVEVGRQYRTRIRVRASRESSSGSKGKASSAASMKLFPDGATVADVDIDVAFELHRAASSSSSILECFEANVVRASEAEEEEAKTQPTEAVKTVLRTSLAVLTMLSAERAAVLCDGGAEVGTDALKLSAVERLPLPLTTCASTAQLHQLLRADSIDGEAAGMSVPPTLRSLDRVTLPQLETSRSHARRAQGNALPPSGVRFIVNESTGASKSAAEVGFPLGSGSGGEQPALLIRYYARDASGSYSTLAAFGVAAVPSSCPVDGTSMEIPLSLRLASSSSASAVDASMCVEFRRFTAKLAASRVEAELESVGFDTRSAQSFVGGNLVALWNAKTKVRSKLRAKRSIVSAMQGAANALLKAKRSPVEEGKTGEVTEDEGEDEEKADTIAVTAEEEEAETEAETEAKAGVDAAAPRASTEEATTESDATGAAAPVSPSAAAPRIDAHATASPAASPATSPQAQASSATTTAQRFAPAEAPLPGAAVAAYRQLQQQQQLVQQQQKMLQTQQQQQIVLAEQQQARSRAQPPQEEQQAQVITRFSNGRSVRNLAITESAVQRRIEEAVREMSQKLAAAESVAAKADAVAARANGKVAAMTRSLTEERDARILADAERDGAVATRTLIESQLNALNSDVTHKRALIDRLTTEVDDRAAAVRRCSVEVLHLQRAKEKMEHEATLRLENERRRGKEKQRVDQDALVSDNELDQLVSLAAVGSAQDGDSSDPATMELALRGVSKRDVGRLNKNVVRRLRVVVAEHREAELRSSTAHAEMVQMKRQLVGSRLVVERLRKLEKAHMTQQRALQELQHENQQIEKLEAAVQTQEAVIEKLEEIVRTRSDELHAANARDDMVAVERQREAEMHTALLDSKSEVDAHCVSLEGEVESMRAAQATLQRQKQDLGRQVERLKQQQQQFQSQPQGGGSGADTMNKSEAEMMFAVKDAKIEAMQAQMLNNALRFAAEIADLETVNMELTGQLQSRARGESSVPQTR